MYLMGMMDVTAARVSKIAAISSHDGVFEGNLSLYVRDTESLNALLDRIRKIKGIETVKRLAN